MGRWGNGEMGRWGDGGKEMPKDFSFVCVISATQINFSVDNELALGDGENNPIISSTPPTSPSPHLPISLPPHLFCLFGNS